MWLSVADSYALLVLQLASTMIIARLLTPAEVGVFAIAAVFSMLASMFRDFGIAEYMIQERELTAEKIAAAFGLNIVASWGMAAALFFGAGPAASFYANAGVGEVMRVQALSFVLVPFGAVTMAWFRRELNFTPILASNVAGSVTGFVVSIGLALAGFGYMSLAWSAVASIAVTVAISLAWRPRDFPRWPSLRGVGPVFHFSKYVVSMWVAGQAGRGAPELVIGRAEGVVEVAMFSRAAGLLEMFNRLVMRTVQHVAMPYFARSDRESGDLAEPYLRSVAYVTGLGWAFFAFIGLAAFAAIRIVYGPQWDAAAVLAPVLCLAGAIDAVHAMSRDALLVRGRAREGNALQFIVVALQVAGLLLVVPFGLPGAAWGMVAAAAAGFVVTQVYLRRHIGLTWRGLVRACLPSLGLAAFAVAPAALWALLFGGPSPEAYLAFGFGGGALTVVAWLVGVHVLRHPLAAEVASVRERVAGWLGRSRPA